MCELYIYLLTIYINYICIHNKWIDYINLYSTLQIDGKDKMIIITFIGCFYRFEEYYMYAYIPWHVELYT